MKFDQSAETRNIPADSNNNKHKKEFLDFLNQNSSLPDIDSSALLLMESESEVKMTQMIASKPIETTKALPDPKKTITNKPTQNAKQTS